MSASQEQPLSGRGARVYTAHRGWLGVATDISAASTGSVLVMLKVPLNSNEPTSVPCLGRISARTKSLYTTVAGLSQLGVCGPRH